MPDYFGETSPWGEPTTDTGFAPFDDPIDTTSPWTTGNGNAEDDDSRSHTSRDELNPYDSTPYSPAAPLVSSEPTSQPEFGDEETQETPTPSTAPEPVPELKSVDRKSNKSKKKRAQSVKVEDVAHDPLAAHTSPLESVALTTDSVANMKLDSEGRHHYSPSFTQREGAAPTDEQTSSSLSSPSLTAAGSKAAYTPQHKSQFEIMVGDPSTIRDLTNAHTEYTIQMTTTSDKYEIKESAVQRRYRDFRWLYKALRNNHPGVVVPPPPDKQAIGRFNDDFVQQRRAGLEQMLRKITAHPLLCDDRDLEAFLTSSDFGEYLNKDQLAEDGDERRRSSGSNAGSESRATTLRKRDSATASSGTGGFMGTLSGALSLSKGNEADPWAIDKKNHLDRVENQLREVCKDLVSMSIHRQQLSDALGEYANVLRVLSDIEATPRLSKVLRSFAKVHDRLSQIYQRQRQQNMLTLEATLDEHLRTVNSIRDALAARQRVFSSAENAASELEKQQVALDKLLRQGKTQEDRQKALEEEISELAQTATQMHHRAAEIAHLVESELNRVNEEKIEEFRNNVEIYLENTVEAQKESIEIWETFYTRNFASNE